ncbi:MAG: YtxH domain-containing protein [bacterium]
MSRNDTASFVSAVILGGIIGATLGILFAPAKGETTRRAIKKEANRISKDMEKEAKEFVNEKIDPMIKDVKEKMEDAKGDVDKYVDSKKKQLASRLAE